MEPMRVGSPSSPSSPQHGKSFLPNHLFGDNQLASTPYQTSGRLFSPTKSRSPPVAPNSPTYPTAAPVACTTSPPAALNRSILNTPGTEKHGGPPISSLSSKVLLESNTPQKSYVHNLDNSINFTQGSHYINSPSNSFISTPQRDLHTSVIQSPQFNMSGVGELTSTWVTVYGFPTMAASYILSQFSCLGSILQHNISPTGNWMHIQYQTKLQARKALSKNGKIFSNTIKIAVEPCKEESILNESQKENISLVNTSIMGAESTPKSSMRPLTQSAYKTAQEKTQVLSTTLTPQKNESVISKAMEYFGW